MPSIFPGSAGSFDSAGFAPEALLLACAEEFEAGEPDVEEFVPLLEFEAAGFASLFDVAAPLLQPASGRINSAINKIAGLLVIVISMSIPIDL